MLLIRSLFFRTGAFLRSCLYWDKPFVLRVLLLMLPMVLQDLVAASLHILDGLMVSGLGDTAYSAVIQANRFTFIFQLFTFGSSTGSAIFFSQYWGARDIPRMRHTMGLALIVCIGFSLLFTLGGLLFPRQIISLYLLPGESFELAVEYLRIVAPCYLLMAINAIYASSLKASEKTYIPMIAGIVGISLNTALNYAFIYGKLGAPAMGVSGAALATVISSVAILAVNLTFAYGKRLPAGAYLREMIGWDRGFPRKFLKTATPVIINEGLWGLGVTLYSVFYGRMGDMSVAAIGLQASVNDLVWVVLMAMTSAAAIMVGKMLGEHNRTNAYLYAKRLLAGGFAAGLVLGCFLFFMRIPLTSIFTGLSEATRSKAQILLALSAPTFCLRAFNCINVVGVLRSGGDTMFSMILDVGSLWLIGIPLAGIGSMLLGWPIEYVYCCTFADEILKFFVGIPHFRSQKWMHILTSQKELNCLDNH